MAYKIVFDKKASDDFKKLDNSVQKDIQKFINNKLSKRDDPRTLGGQLTGNLSKYWKYKVGDYRLVASIKDDVITIMFLVIAHRREVYKKASSRLK